jgi:hypothetical protein
VNELFIYQLFKEIFRHSTVMEGRFFVVRSGSDTNIDNHGEIVRDFMGGLTILNKKYPAAILFPPMESVQSYAKGWSTFRMVMYFLTKDGRTGANELKTPDYNALISDHSAILDWKDMRECAGDFRVALTSLVRQPSIGSKIRTTNSSDSIDRITWVGNDKLNGVRLQFDLELFMPCELADYPDNLFSLITIPDANPHPLHKH